MRGHWLMTDAWRAASLLLLVGLWSCGPDSVPPAAPRPRVPKPQLPLAASILSAAGIGGAYSMPASGNQVGAVALGPTGLIVPTGLPSRVVVGGAITRQPTSGLLFFCSTVEWQWYCQNVWQDLVSDAPISPAGIWGIYARATVSWDGGPPAPLAGDSTLSLTGPAGTEVWAGRSSFACYYELSVKNPDGSWKYPYDFGPCHTFGGGFTVTVQPDDGGGALLVTATPGHLPAGGGSVTFAARAADGSALQDVNWQYVPDAAGSDSVPLASAGQRGQGAGMIPADIHAAMEGGEIYSVDADRQVVKGRPAGGGIFFVKAADANRKRMVGRGAGAANGRPQGGGAVLGSACDGSATCLQAVTHTGSMVVQATVHGRGLSAAARVLVGAGGGRPPIPPRVVITPTYGGMLAPMDLGSDHEILEISVVDSAGVRLPGRNVTLTLKAQEGTAGHAHVGGKPAGALEGEDQATVVTGADGWAHVMFRAPAASGPVEVHGSSDGATAAVDTIGVGLAGLVTLVASSSDSLIGGRAEHPDNHYGTPGMVALVSALADSLARRKVAFDSLPDTIRRASRFPAKLGVNDMSLALGGLFDWRATWAPPHDEHRTGQNADIDVRNGAADDLYADAVTAVWRFAFQRGVGDERVARNHIHLKD